MTGFEELIARGGPWERAKIVGDCLLLQGDCRAILPRLPPVAALVTDPPYGIGESAGRARKRTSPPNAKVRHDTRRDYGDKGWDDRTADEAVAMARAKADHAIIFGGNYYDLPPTSCWLVWDKMNGETDFADCELAWTNLSKAVRQIRFLWNGCMRRERDIPREHPTQKPVGVMRWCLSHLPPLSGPVLDPFMGSGTTLVACAKEGLAGIGIDQDPDYFDIAVRRVRAAYVQPDLFHATAGPDPPPIDTSYLI